MNNTLPRPKRYKGLYAWEFAASIKILRCVGMMLLSFGSAQGKGEPEKRSRGRREDAQEEKSKMGLGPGQCRSFSTWAGACQKSADFWQ